MRPDYYELLRIPAAATFDEVHRAYRLLAMQFHPDHNPTADAARKMRAINEAYAVLSEPARRREYDEERKTIEPFDLAGSVLRGAYQTLLKKGWVVARSTDTALLLEQGRLLVQVVFVPRLNNALLKKIGRQVAMFSVVLAVEIEKPINLSLHVSVIDLMNSSHHGAPFPDPAYRELFAPFL